jgi:hypothetical protein
MRPRSTGRSLPWIRSSSRTRPSTEMQRRAQLHEGQRDGQMVVQPPPVSANLALHHDTEPESGLAFGGHPSDVQPVDADTVAHNRIGRIFRESCQSTF